MANNGIRGITIELNGDTTGLDNALRDVNRQSKNLQSELKEVEKALKLDPSNAELVAQKMRLLQQSVDSTQQRLLTLRTAHQQVERQFQSGQIGEEQYRAFQRELINTESELRRLQTTMDSVNGDQERLTQTTNRLGAFFVATGTNVDQFADVLGTRLTQSIRNGTASADQMERALRLMGRQALGSSTDIDEMRRVLDQINNGSPIDDVRADLERLRNSAGQADQQIQTLNETLRETGENLKEVGSTMTAGVTAPIAAFGVGVGVAATQFNDASARIQMALGTTDEKTKELNESAKRVWKDGFGESLDEVINGLVRTRQNIQSISDGQELETITRNALLLAKTFDSDVNEVTRAANNLMINFGITSEKAFDLLTRGAQEGLNFSNELFDNTAEYSGLWASAGFTAEEYFDVLKNGTQEGVYNLDFLNDVVKEFNILVKDGSKSTSDAMGLLSKDTQALWKSFLDGEGTASDVFYQVLNELKGMDDQILASQIGVSLFGTKFEDLETYAMYALGSVDGGLSDITGSMEKLAEVQEETFGQRWDSMTRNAASSLEPVGLILLDFVEQWLPKIIALIQVVAQWFSNLSPVLQLLVVSFGAVIAAIGPLIILIGAIVSSIGTLIPLFASGGTVATGFGAVMAAITGPIGIAVVAITGIITALVTAYSKIEWFRDGVNAIWTTIKDYTAIAFGAVKELVTSLISSTVDFAKGILDRFKGFWDENGQAIMSLVQEHFGKVKSNIEMVMGIIKGVFEVIWPIISNTVRVTWETIQLVIETALDLILGVIQTVMKLIEGDWKGAWESIKGIGENIMNNIINYFKDIDLAQTGKDIINGLVKGIGSMAGAVKKKVEELAANIPAWAKKILGIHSPSRVMRDEVGKHIPSGVTEGIVKNFGSVKKATQDMGKVVETVAKENAKSLSTLQKKLAESEKKDREAINKEIVALQGKLASDQLSAIRSYINEKKSINQLSLIDELAYWRESLKLFANGSKERTEAHNEYKKSLKAVNDAIVSINENYQSQMKSIDDKLLSDIKAANDAYDQAYNSRVDAIRNFSGLFDEFVSKTEKSGANLLSNLQSQVDGLKVWKETLASLGGRITDEGLMNELTALGPNSLGELQALNSLSDEELSKYVGLYNEKFALAREQATLELSGMKEDTVLRIAEMTEAANEELAVLQTKWMEAIKGVTKATSDELTSLTQVGRDAGQGLLNGLQSMKGPLIAKAMEIANAIRSAIQSALDIHSPSRVMKGFGINIGEGLIVGMDEMISKVAQSSARLSDAVMNAQASLANSANKTMQYGSSNTNSPTSIDNRKTFAPVINNYGVANNDKAMERTLRRLAFQFN